MEKTDNHNLHAKLELRRHFLRKYHADGSASVFDAFQGSGIIWGQLRKEFTLANYWGVDLKPKAGRLKIDSLRILQQPGWTANVIDLDCYGQPWKYFTAAMQNGKRDLTVFLTIGCIFSGPLSHCIRGIIGIGELTTPNAFTAELNHLGTDYFLASPSAFGYSVLEAAEAPNDGNARYIGLRLIYEGASPVVNELTTGQRAETRGAKKE